VSAEPRRPPGPGLTTVLRSWGRIGCLGFGGPPAHIRLLRELCVERQGWIGADEFEDAIATCNLLPGPSSTQLAIFTAWRVRGRPGAVVGGLAFILPGLVAIAVHAGWGLTPASWTRRASTTRWVGCVLAGGLAAALLGSWVVVVLLACGFVELVLRHPPRNVSAVLPLAVGGGGSLGAGVLLSLVWTSFKVGALSYGGGFVIIPLMQADAVEEHRWMSGAEFLNAVALGQVTPGPVVHTVAVVGYAAAGLAGGLLAASVAFGPSFAFVLLGGRHFDRLRQDRRVRAFLAGAGPAAIGAIYGAAAPLAREISHPWQWAVLAGAALALLALRRGVVGVLVTAALVGAAVTLLG